MYCIACGHGQLPDNARFCPACGAEQPGPAGKPELKEPHRPKVVISQSVAQAEGGEQMMQCFICKEQIPASEFNDHVTNAHSNMQQQ